MTRPPAFQALWNSIHSLFEKDFYEYDEKELEISILLLDKLVGDLKEHLEKENVEGQAKVLPSFYSLFTKKYRGTEYCIELGTVLGEKTFQFMISLNDPLYVVDENKFIYKNTLAYRLDLTKYNQLVCLSKVHRLDSYQNFL